MGTAMRAATPLLLLALLVTACSPGASDDGRAPGAEQRLTVLAAASLTGTFRELAAVFEAEHPGVEVRLAFDSSATLATQVLQGAPADVLATADEATMDSAAPALAGPAEVIASNTLVLVTPAANPAGITGFSDLAQTDRADGADGRSVTWVACVESAPCGRVWAELAARNDVRSEPASLEVDVKAVLAKVTSGEVDAGLVYRTDAIAAGESVRVFDVPGADEQVTRYPVAPVAAGRTELAADFLDLVTSATGREILAAAGFGPP